MAAAKSDVLIKLVLVFFISLLSFSIGTFVGKNYSDNQHRRAALEPNAHGQARSTASHDSHQPAAHEKTMSDEEISKLAAEFAEEDAVETAHGEHAKSHDDKKSHDTKHTAKHDAHATSSVTAKADSHAKPSAPAQNIAHGKTALPKSTIQQKANHESRIPSSIPKDVAQYSVGKFTVQIASFPTESDAKHRAEELKAKGYSAFFIPAQVKGKTWYRVSVGLFATENEAKTYRHEFMSKNNVNTAIVQKITN